MQNTKRILLVQLTLRGVFFSVDATDANPPYIKTIPSTRYVLGGGGSTRHERRAHHRWYKVHVTVSHSRCLVVLPYPRPSRWYPTALCNSAWAVSSLCSTFKSLWPYWFSRVSLFSFTVVYISSCVLYRPTAGHITARFVWGLSLPPSVIAAPSFSSLIVLSYFWLYH